MNGAPSTLVSPGLYGFFAFFLLGLALYLLMRNMNGRMRRMSYRSEELAREAEAERAAEQARKGNGPARDNGSGTAAGTASDTAAGTASDKDAAPDDANGPASGESPSAEPQ